MPSNILVHLAPCEIRVHFGNAEYTIPSMTAHQWCQILLGGPVDPYDVFPTLAGPQAVMDVEDAIDRGGESAEDLIKVAMEIVTVAGDRPWWVTIRVLEVAAEVWDRIGGTLVKEGVDARHLPLAAWLDAIWFTMTSYVERDKIAAWRHQIEAAPKGWESEIDFDENEQAFLAAMQSVM